MVDIFGVFHAVKGVLPEVEYVSAWTGLSLGVLAALGVLAWFDPLLRSWAIRSAIFAAIAYAAILYGYRSGVYDKGLEWQAANVEAAKAAVARDAATKKATSDQFTPVIAERDQMVTQLQAKVASYEKQLSSASRKCTLGNAAGWVRGTETPNTTPIPISKPVQPKHLSKSPPKRPVSSSDTVNGGH